MEQDFLIEEKLSWYKRLPLLFVTAYLFWYMFPMPAEELPLLDKPATWYGQGFNAISIWLGNTFLQQDIAPPDEMNGSGDTTLDYVKLLTSLLLATVFTLVAAPFINNAGRSKKLVSFVTIYARYFTGIIMISYGVAKIFGEQFPFPDLRQLEQTYGNSSPMGLLWTFMGYSQAYSSFTGMGEILGGLLLFFRRTTALGALITMGIMINVMMLNYSYDVPVKIFSTHLVLIAIFILGPDVKRIFGFFVLRRETSLTKPAFEFSQQWIRVARVAVKIIAAIVIPIWMAYDYSSETLKYRQEADGKGLNGVYYTQTFICNNREIQPLLTDTIRWRKILLENGMAVIYSMADGPKAYYNADIDTARRELILTSYADSNDTYQLHYENMQNKMFTLAGTSKSDSIKASFKKKGPEDYFLVKRGFNWVNEYPYNM